VWRETPHLQSFLCDTDSFFFAAEPKSCIVSGLVLGSWVAIYTYVLLGRPWTPEMRVDICWVYLRQATLRDGHVRCDVGRRQYTKAVART
jgi:hypothetical protein